MHIASPFSPPLDHSSIFSAYIHFLKYSIRLFIWLIAIRISTLNLIHHSDEFFLVLCETTGFDISSPQRAYRRDQLFGAFISIELLPQIYMQIKPIFISIGHLHSGDPFYSNQISDNETFCGERTWKLVEFMRKLFKLYFIPNNINLSPSPNVFFSFEQTIVAELCRKSKSVRDISSGHHIDQWPCSKNEFENPFGIILKTQCNWRFPANIFESHLNQS